MTNKKTANISPETAFDERIQYLPNNEKELIEKYRRLGQNRKQMIDEWFEKQTLGPYLISDADIEHIAYLNFAKTATENERKLFALDAFVYAIDNNFPLPKWLQQHLKNNFSKYLHTQYLTLDQLIGKTAKTEGGTNEVQKTLDDERNNFAFYNICIRLCAINNKTGTKYKIKEAIEETNELINQYAKQMHWKQLSITTLQDYWHRKKWNKLCKNLVASATYCKNLGNRHLKNHPFTNPYWLWENRKKP